jgi:hypothetical protein
MVTSTSDAGTSDPCGTSGSESAALAAEGPVATVIKEFGVIHLKNALSEAEQAKLYKMISSHVTTRPATNPIPANFHLSSGEVGAKQRNQPLHDCGELLYARFAKEVAAQLSPETISAEPALARLARVHSGAQPVRVDHVSGVSYLAHSVLDTHQDGPMPLYTMSVALGDACDFVVGAPLPKGRKAYPTLRTGTPATLLMASGDAIFFDGGSVSHAVPRIHKGTAPSYLRQLQQSKGFQGARISVLFREPDGWDAKYLG